MSFSALENSLTNFVLRFSRLQHDIQYFNKFGRSSTQRKSAHDHQRIFRILITTATTVRNILLMVENIITSHTGIAHHVEHNPEGTQPHHGFNLLISVECACIEHDP